MIPDLSTSLPASVGVTLSGVLVVLLLIAAATAGRRAPRP
jgi:hypothetical protein